MDSAKSTRSYDSPTLKLLWGRAAGRCALPQCRIELFVSEPDYDPVCIIGEMGHVAASSDAGPRGDTSLALAGRDKYANLILLCRNCHRKIDVLYAQYPPERLQQIKTDHETWVRTALPERGLSSIQCDVILLRGEFPFDPTTIAEAILPANALSETQISVSTARKSWEAIQEQLRSQIGAVALREEPVASRILVFPLAPVSACLYTGYLLTNRVHLRAFQYQRDIASWVWSADDQTLSTPTFIETQQSTSKSADVFFLFSLTALVDAEEIRATVGGDQAVYVLSVADPSTAWLKSKAQLDELARKSREMFEAAAMRYPISKRWHIFYAGPAPGAIVAGQQLNPTMIPEVQCYEFQRPTHKASILITPSDSLAAKESVREN